MSTPDEPTGPEPSSSLSQQQHPEQQRRSQEQKEHEGSHNRRADVQGGTHANNGGGGGAIAPTASAGSAGAEPRDNATRDAITHNVDPNTPPAAADSPSATAGSTTGAAASAAGFVAPSSYLRPIALHHREGSHSNEMTAGSLAESTVSAPGKQKYISPLDKEQIEGLRAIRAFLKVRTSYDVLPLSYRLIIFDTSLLVKKSLNILTHCGIVSAPLWESKTSTVAGLLTVTDYINLVQYYWQHPDAFAQIDKFKLNSLRDIERAIGATPIETVSIHPLRPLYEACVRMLESRARRIPLIDVDDETQREMVVSVVTQYRILKFVSVNVKETQMLRKPLRDLPNMGTFVDLATATMDTPVMEVIGHMVKRNLSCVPLVDRDNTVLNVFEAVDVISLIKGGDYDNLNLSAGKALEKRSEDFPGIYTCTLNDRLDTVFDTIRKSRVHRLVVVDEYSKLRGVLSLSDILDYTLNSALGDGDDDDLR